MTEKKSYVATPTLREVWSLLWNRMGSNRLIFIFALLLSLGQTFAMMLFPLISNLYFDYLDGERFGSIQLLLVTSTVAFLLVLVMYAFGEYLKKTITTELSLVMTVDLANEAQRLPLEAAQASHSSDLVQRVTNDTKRTTEIMSTILDDMGNQIVMFLLALIYILWLNWKIGLVLLIVSPLLLLFSHLLRNKLKQIGYEVAEQEAVVRQYQQDTIQNMEMIHAYGIGNWMEERFVKERMQLNKLYMRRMWWRQAVGITSSTIISIIVIGTVVTVGWLAIRNMMTLGALMAFFTLVWRLNSPLSSIASLWGKVQEGLGGAERIYSLIRAEKEPKINNSISITSADNTISLKSVRFSYHRNTVLEANILKEMERGDNLLLDNFSLQVDSGAFIAIVGPSGSGKSTVAKIAAGLLLPDYGEVYIGSLNPLEDAEYAREKVAYVPQSTYLFTGTIRDNLLIAKPNAREKEIENAAKMALAHEFINALPNGYDTELAEQGNSLSGGQKQRLAIARAILVDRPIWILDEATSALDYHTERKVMDNLLELAKERKRTTIVIAHRLETVQTADHIVVMKNGRIIQQGNHQELLSDNNDLYRQMSGEGTGT